MNDEAGVYILVTGHIIELIDAQWGIIVQQGYENFHDNGVMVYEYDDAYYLELLMTGSIYKGKL